MEKYIKNHSTEWKNVEKTDNMIKNKIHFIFDRIIFDTMEKCIKIVWQNDKKNKIFFIFDPLIFDTMIK